MNCLLKAFAQALEMEIIELTLRVGHDGMGMQWPDLDEPLCRRGFHIQEFVKVAWECGYVVALFDRYLMQAPNYDVRPLIWEIGLPEIKGEKIIYVGPDKNEIRHAQYGSRSEIVSVESMYVLVRKTNKG